MEPQVSRVALALDVVCFRVEGGTLQVLLMQRADEPFAGCWALPGGVVLPEEPLDAAAQRVLSERTGAAGPFLEQLYTFGDPQRDPRGRTISVTYYGLLPGREQTVRAGRGAAAVAWHSMDSLPALAFDHGRIVRYARWRLQQKIGYAPLVFQVLPESFTMGDLRGIHEAILGRALHPSNFVRLMLSRWDLAPVSGQRDRRSKRPARLYRYIGPPEIPGPPPQGMDGPVEPGSALPAPAENRGVAGT